MKNSKKFKDFKNWGKTEIESTEELINILTELIWCMRPKCVRVKFCDTTKKDFVVLNPDYTKDLFKALGDISPEEIQFINLYSKDYNFELENFDLEFSGPKWSCGIFPNTLEDKILLEEDN